VRGKIDKGITRRIKEPAAGKRKVRRKHMRLVA
jgi:hypothetical protein